jgi:uncharacterized protein YbjT (DUF2867 family)
MKIAVLGASGTVGQALLPLLAQQHEVLAVSRRPREETSGVRWAVADASDAESLKKVFDQVDIAYYLVHSLGSRDFEQRDRVTAAMLHATLSKPRAWRASFVRTDSLDRRQQRRSDPAIEADQDAR